MTLIRRRNGIRGPATIGVQLVAVISSLAMLSTSASAGPGDVTTSPAPVMGADAPARTTVEAGDAKVSPQTGSLGYGFSIAVPPGRGGAVPSIGLNYSSQGALYGGIAAGWTLTGVPEIRRDYSKGYESFDRPGQWATKPRWLSSMAGGRELVLVDEPYSSQTMASYRAQADTSFTRYQRAVHSAEAVYSWVALTTDGARYEFGFGGSDFDDWAPLTRYEDAFGNEVAYKWERVFREEPQQDGTTRTVIVDRRLVRIEYSANANAGLEHHAEVNFEYSTDTFPCANRAVGAQLQYTGAGPRWKGASKLVAINTAVKKPGSSSFERVRRYELGYNQAAEDCDAPHTPNRLLESVTQKDGTGQVLRPPTTFTYGAMGPSLAGSLSIKYDPGTPMRQSLASGKRVVPNGFIVSTSESQFLDVNADNRPDRISENAGDGDARCRISWNQNSTAPGKDVAFLPSVSSTGQGVPPIPWANATSNLHPGTMQESSMPAPEPKEHCSLTGQYSRIANLEPSGVCVRNNLGHYNFYRFLDINSDGFPDLVTAMSYDATWWDPNLPPAQPGATLPAPQNAPAVGGACRVPAQTCLDSAIRCEGNSCKYNYKKLNTCMQQAPTEPCFDTAVHAEPVYMINMGGRSVPHNLTVPADPTPPGGNCPNARKPESAPGGNYRWLMYPGRGDGTFDMSNVKVISSPVPLASHTADEVVHNGSFSSASSVHSIIDLDGDGHLDVVHITSESSAFWHFWRGNGTGEFNPQPDGVPWQWAVPPGARPRSQSSSQIGIIDNAQMSGMADINGDGRPDYIQFHTGAMRVYYNTGTGFATEGYKLAGQHSMSQSLTEIKTLDGDDAKHWTMSRMVDVDGDGRADWQGNLSTSIDSSANVFWNMAGGLSSSQPSPGGTSFQETTDVTATDWATKRSAMDINGDGITDIVTRGSTTAQTATTNGDRRAVLKTINNGHGLVTTIKYASHVDPSGVVTMGNGNLPRATWVVSSLSRIDDYSDTGAAKERWNYHYIGPVWGEDDDRRHGFRGFKSVETTSPTGAFTVASYAYDQDKTGRQVGTVVYADAGDLAHPSSISTTSWQPAHLFGTSIRMFHAIRSESRTCSAGQTTASCQSSGALLATDTVFAPIKPTGAAASDPAVAFVTDSSTRSTQSVGPVAGDRKASNTYALYYDASNYRLRTRGDKREHYSSGEWSVSGGTDYVYDAAGLVVETTMAWRDGDTKILTHRQYDMATGNLLGRIKPNQYHAGGINAPKEKYHYKGKYRLFVTSSSNEAGHMTETTHDLATGALVSTRGPNVKQGKHEEVRVVIDSQGRPVEKWVTIEGSANTYLDKLIEKTTYYDHELPLRVRTERRVEYNGTRWIAVDKRVDGHGRLLDETTFPGNGLPNAVNKYVYDVSGNVVAFRTPDPTDDAGYVEYTYSFDSLGRPTGVRNPNGDGANSTWNGLEQTVSECEDDGAGTCIENDKTTAKKRLFKDVYGRLLRVQEALAGGGWASTKYDYDANDNLSLIVNAEGDATVMEHNWLGQRLAITRAGQTWRYGYDLNGNMDSQVLPHADGTDPMNYTVTIGYDHLDRVTSRIVPPTDLSPQDANELAVDLIANSYDQGSNGIGRLHTVSHPNHVLQLSYEYDGRGRTIVERATFNLTLLGQPQLSDTRENRFDYNALGQVVNTTYADKNGSQAGTHTNTGYDLRGMPTSVTTGSTTLATYTRNVAGQIVSRTSPNSDRSYAYDRLGRVTDDVAIDSAGKIQFGHAFTYHKTGDVASLTSQVAGTKTRNFSFAFDRRHQLRKAADDRGYSTQLGYSVLGKITSTQVAVPETARAALNRNVTYNYGLSPDKQAPDELWDAAKGVSRARNFYDLRGNVITRKVGSEGSVNFKYDGNGDQRVASAGKKAGEELYYYASAGTRILAVRRDSSGAVDRVRLWLGGTEIWYDASGDVTKSWAHVGLGSPVARIERKPAVVDPGCSWPQYCGSSYAAKIEYSHHSMLGNLIVSLDEDGVAVAGFQYGAFGEVLASTGDVENHLRRFNGKEDDQLSGLSYYGYRYYDKLFMGWTQSDPLYRVAPDRAWDEPRRMNLYVFSLNNPLRYVDPDGRDFIDGLLSKADGLLSKAKAGAKWVAKRGVKMAICAICVIVEDSTSSLRDTVDSGKQLVAAVKNPSVTGLATFLGTAIAARLAGAAGGKFAKKLFKKKPCCFVAGTQVRTPTGQTAIERLEPGDLVLARDHQRAGEDSTPPGQREDGELESVLHRGVTTKPALGRTLLRRLAPRRRLAVAAMVSGLVVSSYARVDAFDGRQGGFAHRPATTLNAGDEVRRGGRLYRVAKDGSLVSIAYATPAQVDLAHREYNQTNSRPPLDADVVWLVTTDSWGHTPGHYPLASVGGTVHFQGRRYTVERRNGARWLVDTGIIAQKIRATFVRKNRPVWTLVVRSASGETQTIRGTPDHPFYVPSRDLYVPLARLRAGWQLLPQGGVGVKVVSVTDTGKRTETYNFHVAAVHNYFVAGVGGGGGGPGVLVHNSNCNRKAGGGKTGRKQSKHAIANGQRKVADARATRDALRSKPNKTQADKAALSRADRALNKAEDQLRASENHAKKTQKRKRRQ